MKPISSPSAPPDLAVAGGTPSTTPRTAAELTAQNVETIAALERDARNQASRADRVAGRITRFCGSMRFVWLHVFWFVLWIGANTHRDWRHIDPYPFNFLTLVVSLEAIFLSTFIMIAENRQERIDERRSHLDLQINLLAEQENTKMLELLEKIARKLEIDLSGDPSVTVLKEVTKPEALLRQIDATVTEAEDQQAAEGARQDARAKDQTPGD